MGETMRPLGQAGSFWAVLLALVVVLAMLPGVGLADDDNDNNDEGRNKDKPGTSQQTIVPANARPDLKIEYSGFSPPNLEHTITFTVTNVGKAPSSAIKAQIQTVSGGPPNPATPDVPVLAPQQSHVLFYGIGACNGQVVQATVNDPLDFPSVNDRAEKTCPTKSPVESKPSGPVSPSNDPLARSGGAGTDAFETAQEALKEPPVPAHLQLGQHVWEVPATVGLKRTVWRDGGLNGCSLGHYPGDVGFSFYDGPLCNSNEVTQFFTEFDLVWLRSVDRKLITRAELLYGENVFDAQNADGDDVTDEVRAAGQSCIGRVGLAPKDVKIYFGPNGLNSLVETEAIDGVRLQGGWDVTREIQLAMSPTPYLYGFILHPLDENLDADSDRTCKSFLQDVRLRLFYSIL